MNKPFAVGDRVVIVGDVFMYDIPIGSTGSVIGHICGDDVLVKMDDQQLNGETGQVYCYPHEIEHIEKESDMEKTYTITLTEEEAIGIKAIIGCFASVEGTLGAAVGGVWNKLGGLYEGVSWDTNSLPQDVKSSLCVVSNTTFNPCGRKGVYVTLNNNYTATLTPESITVGCQTFPLSVIDELVAAREKLNV